MYAASYMHLIEIRTKKCSDRHRRNCIKLGLTLTIAICSRIAILI